MRKLQTLGVVALCIGAGALLGSPAQGQDKDTCREHWASGTHYHVGDYQVDKADVCYGNAGHGAGVLEFFSMETRGDRARGKEGPDEIHMGPSVSSNGAEPEVGNGGQGHDTLYGGDQPDHLDGGRGNDYVAGNGGSDLSVYGGPGSDTVNGGASGDHLFGGAGHDTLTDVCCATDKDNVSGGTGIDGVDVEDGDNSDDVFAESCESVIMDDFDARNPVNHGSCDRTTEPVVDNAADLIEGLPDDLIDAILSLTELPPGL